MPINFDMHRWYDERYYLKESGYSDRKPHNSLILRAELLKLNEEKQFFSLLEEYDNFIEKSTSLVKSLSMKDNSISIMICIGKLIDLGVFSFDGNFTKEETKDDLLITRRGINVLSGVGCCRHVSSFSNDIMQKLGEYSRLFGCVCLDEKDKDIALVMKANHLANLIYYNEVPYVFDAYNNNTLFKFISDFELIPIDSTLDVYFHYKPYNTMVEYKTSLTTIKKELETYKESVGKSISLSLLSEITACTHSMLERSSDGILDFVSDTKEDMKRIKQMIKEIKK